MIARDTCPPQPNGLEAVRFGALPWPGPDRLFLVPTERSAGVLSSCLKGVFGHEP
jgi:hypothetical protein